MLFFDGRFNFNFKPLYTNKKVQLQLDFLISPAVAGLFFKLVIKKVQLQLDFLISPAVAGLFISPATAGRELKILTILLYEGKQE